MYIFITDVSKMHHRAYNIIKDMFWQTTTRFPNIKSVKTFQVFHFQPYQFLNTPGIARFCATQLLTSLRGSKLPYYLTNQRKQKHGLVFIHEINKRSTKLTILQQTTNMQPKHRTQGWRRQQQTNKQNSAESLPVSYP